MDHRSVAFGWTVLSRAGFAASLRAPRCRPPASEPAFDFGGFSSSTSAFHSPHAGHCPCQRAVSLPHSVQKKAVLVLAMARGSAYGLRRTGYGVRGTV